CWPVCPNLGLEILELLPPGHLQAGNLRQTGQHLAERLTAVLAHPHRAIRHSDEESVRIIGIAGSRSRRSGEVVWQSTGQALPGVGAVLAAEEGRVGALGPAPAGRRDGRSRGEQNFRSSWVDDRRRQI